jgi:hypothetical protein
MKSFQFVAYLFIAIATLLLASCDTGKPKKPKPVPPPGTGDTSSLGWNRPQKWEGQRGAGGLLPQSR